MASSNASFAKKPIKKFDVKKETQKLFDRNAPKLEKSRGAIIGNSEFFVGDLNDDGLDDALVFIILNPAEGGNMVVGREMIIYINKGKKMTAFTTYDSDKIFRPVEIKKNKIHLIEYEYTKGDSLSNPSIEKHKYLILNGKKLTESRVYD